MSQAAQIHTANALRGYEIGKMARSRGARFPLFLREAGRKVAFGTNWEKSQTLDSRPGVAVWKGMPRVARAANTAGIGWAVLNKRPDYLAELRRTAKAPIFAISSDHFEIGRIQGRQFAASLPGDGSKPY